MPGQQRRRHGGNNNARGNNGGVVGMVEPAVAMAAANNGNIMVRVDPATGLVAAESSPRPRGRPASVIHNVFKKWHRLQFLSGYWGTLGVLNALMRSAWA